MEKGLRAPEDPEASRIRLMVPGELPPLQAVAEMLI